MSESKLTHAHLRRAAVVYVRQSTMAQLARNRESTTRQYDLVARAVELGWPRAAVKVIDEDLGVSGASATGRSGFAELAAQVGLGEVGIVLALEVSRLARNNADWYRLLDLAGMTDTLIADTDGVYHPGLFNDRMLLGMKGTMSEAELHILRARLHGGIRSKAARGELRRPLPVGLVWGEADGEVRWHPDEAVTGVIAAIFERFAGCGSVRGVWLWLREQGLRFPLQRHGYVTGGEEITWVAPSYHAVHNVLTHPAYAGTYVFGRTRAHRSIDADGRLRVSRRVLPQHQWEVLITEHHRGFIDWDTFQTNQSRIRANIRPTAHQPGTGAVREGCALLQGLATCGVCGRKLAVYYDGPAKTTPGYYCTGTGTLVEGKDARHLRVGGAGIDAALAEAFLAALQPAALQACLTAAQQLEDGHHAALAQWRRQLEWARYQASQAERRYRAVDPDNRLVARGLESEWNTALHALADAQAELARRETARPKTLTAQEKSAVLALGDDLPGVWTARTTTDKDRKRLLRSLLDEVNVSVCRDHTDAHAEVVLRWKGGAITDLTVPIKRTPANRLRTNEDTVELVRRLAAHYPDATIAHILNRQGRRTARGLSFTAGRVQSLRHHHEIACHTPTDNPTEGELLTVTDAAKQLGLAPSTLHRWLADGFIAGEQLTPGAPWRIRLTDEIRNLFVDDAPAGWLAMLEATLAYGVSRQTIMQRVKRGELQAVHVRTGRRKGLRIQPPPTQE
ncbi:MAG TPA: recombinase family protein, partial [Streptosporangiaceae bacterium]|nr:recombinase family protein [Streptosporangiaceae bacterium]